MGEVLNVLKNHLLSSDSICQILVPLYHDLFFFVKCIKDVSLNTIKHNYIFCGTGHVKMVGFRFSTLTSTVYDLKENVQFKCQS